MIGLMVPSAFGEKVASISLDPLPTSAEIGERLTFTGTLTDMMLTPSGWVPSETGNMEGYIVYIKDEDPLDADDLLTTAYVNSDGKFSADWFVMNVDSDRVVDVYAVFEGGGFYHRVTTCDPMQQFKGGCCEMTIPLTITGTVVPTPAPTPAPTPTPSVELDLQVAKS